MTRRGFLRGLAQGAAAAALAAVTVVLAKRAIDAPAGGNDLRNCDNRFICRSCGRLGSCGLPQAMSAREGLGVRPEPGRES